MNCGATEILEAFRELVDEYAAEYGAEVLIAEEPASAIEMLAAGQPGGLSLVAYYGGDESDSDEGSWDPRTLATLSLVVYQRQGMGAVGGRGIGEVLRVTDSIREAVSGQLLSGALGGVGYRRMQPIRAPEGRLLHGYVMSFEVRYAHMVS